MQPGFSDIAEGLKKTDLILYMAWSDVRARYKRSVLGPFWITLSTSVGVVGLGFIWSSLFRMPAEEYVPMLTIGLILWFFISNCIVESASVFSRQANIIRNLNLPLSVHIGQLLLRHLINLVHNIPLFILVLLIVGLNPGWVALSAIPNFLLVCANLLWMSMLIAILGARYRDIEYFIGMVMPLLMFFSPVMYRPNALPEFGRDIMQFNPLGNLIEIIRYPLLGQSTPLNIYLADIFMLLVGSAITLHLFNSKKNRIAFWI